LTDEETAVSEGWICLPKDIPLVKDKNKRGLEIINILASEAV
jgi:hypothetical protein